MKTDNTTLKKLTRGEEEFNSRMADYKQILFEQFAESHRLEEEIMKQLDALQFNANVGNNE